MSVSDDIKEIIVEMIFNKGIFCQLRNLLADDFLTLDIKGSFNIFRGSDDGIYSGYFLDNLQTFDETPDYTTLLITFKINHV